MVIISPQALYVPPPVPYDNSGYQDKPSSSSSSGKISPAILFIIIIIAVIFFISGLLHLLVKFLTKHQRSSAAMPENSGPNGDDDDDATAFQRQLQQLFHLHDSGLDQAFIDALPVFVYKEIMGLKEPFDCAVCLCEFSEQDKLRLLPLCSHAFHIECIDTWLLSNSTCPLCRGSLYSPGSLPVENHHHHPVFYLEEPGDDNCGGGPLDNSVSGVVSEGQKGCMESNNGEIHKRVFSVRLGKFRSINVEISKEEEEERRREGETSSTNNSSLDSRRCYSMGSYQYVVGDSDLQVVALRPKALVIGNSNSNSLRFVKGRASGNCEGKKIINIGSKGESFSQSKIWQWPRKGKFPTSYDH